MVVIYLLSRRFKAYNPMYSNGNLVVNIVCPGHSGSTLLGNVLGSHSRGLHIGELVAPLKKGKPVVCRNCLSDPCPIWGTILTETFLRKVYKDFKNPGRISRMLNLYRGSIYRKVFDAFDEIDFIVDSSKNIQWYFYNSTVKTCANKYIFLKRNPCAVLASYKRAYKSNISSHLASVAGTIKDANRFYASLAPDDRIVINYEDLAVNPIQVIESVCSFLQIEFEPRMLEFNERAHHLIGGNHGLIIQNDHAKLPAVERLIQYKTPEKTVEYYRSLNGFRLDERWRTELTEAEKSLIEENLSASFSY